MSFAFTRGSCGRAGSPQQQQMMFRPYPGPGPFLVPQGSVPGSPYSGGVMYAPRPPAMHPGGPGGPRAQMYAGPGETPHSTCSF